MHAPVLLSVFSAAFTDFTILSHKRNNFRKKLLNIKCSLFPIPSLPEIFLILRKINWDIDINVHRSPVKYRLLLSVCNKTWIFSTDYRKILNTQLHGNPSIADGQTDRHDECNNCISQFCDTGLTGLARHNDKGRIAMLCLGFALDCS